MVRKTKPEDIPEDDEKDAFCYKCVLFLVFIDEDGIAECLEEYVR